MNVPTAARRAPAALALAALAFTLLAGCGGGGGGSSFGALPTPAPSSNPQTPGATPTPGPSASPAATPTPAPTPTRDYSRRIAYVAPDAGGVDQVWTINPDGSDALQLTRGALAASQPAWSRDRARLAFVRFRANSNRSDIYIVNADGTGERQLRQATYSDLFPAWSPDGTEIAFYNATSDRDTEESVIGADGSGLRKILESGGQASWSPTGSRLAITANLPGTGGDLLYVINRDGTGRITLVPRPTITDGVNTRSGNDGAPSWSPDGTRVAFRRSFAELSGLYTVDVTSRTVVRITAGATDYAPSWSPDSARLAFTRLLDPNSLASARVYSCDAEGGGANAAQVAVGSGAAW